MPDDWFSPKIEVPYIYLSANPWVCSCDIGYLHEYVDEYANVYIRDGLDITQESESVVSSTNKRVNKDSVTRRT